MTIGGSISLTVLVFSLSVAAARGDSGCGKWVLPDTGAFVAALRGNPKIANHPKLEEIANYSLNQIHFLMEERQRLFNVSGIECVLHFDTERSSLYLETPNGKVVSRESIPTTSFRGVDRTTPGGDPYIQRVPTPFEGIRELNGVLKIAIQDVSDKNRNIENIANLFGLQKTNEVAHGIATPFKDWVFRVHSPEDVIHIEKGIGFDSLEQLKEVLKTQKGLWPAGGAPKLPEYETELDRLARMTLPDRISEIYQIISARKRDSGTYLIGGTNSDFIKGYGNFRIIAEIPREVLLTDTTKGIYEGESEVFVPFFLPKEWIKEIRYRGEAIIRNP